MLDRLFTLTALLLPVSVFAQNGTNGVHLPEPSSIALLALGGVALGAARWWKNRK